MIARTRPRTTTAPSTLRSFFVAWQAPMPATSNLNAPLPVQLAETVRQYQVARAQINARLQRGGASSEEKQHVRALLGEAYRGIEVPLAAASPSSLFSSPTPLVTTLDPRLDMTFGRHPRLSPFGDALIAFLAPP